MKSLKSKLNIIQLILIWILLSPTPSTCDTKYHNVKLQIIPEWVKRGESVILHCIYDNKGDNITSVKWYRGQHEFYRHTPSDNPPSKIVGSSRIKVDLTASNGTHVTIRNVDFWMSGILECEVTADAPFFRTFKSSNNLTVVEMPETAPVLWTERRKYDPGDILRANCSTAPSKPNLDLIFHLNNVEVGNKDTIINPGPDTIPWSMRELQVQILPSHYDNGELLLKCSAVYDTIYNKSTFVLLPNTRTEPIPERVLSPTGGKSSKSSCNNLGLILSSVIVALAISYLSYG